MTIAFIANQIAFGSAPTTSAINTTGANLIVAVDANFTGSTFSDSKSNTWTLIRSQSCSGGNANLNAYYCLNPTTDAAHTFHGNGGFDTICVAAFSGVKTSAALDQQNGVSNGSGVTSQAPGSITPAEANELVVAFNANGPFCASPVSIDSPFSLGSPTMYHGRQDAGPTAIGGGLGYAIQTSAVAANPNFNWTGAGDCCAAIASFKAAAGAVTKKPNGIFPLIGLGTAGVAGLGWLIERRERLRHERAEFIEKIRRAS